MPTASPRPASPGLPGPLQKQELVAALGKAGRLIDVLRRQRTYLEAAALLQVSSWELAEALGQGQGQQRRQQQLLLHA